MSVVNIVDSHCHLDQLDLSAYQGDVNLALQAARAQGVVRMLCVCIDWEHFPDVLAIAEQHEDVHASVGVHPNEQGGYEPTQEALVDKTQHPKVVAIGETGLDYYRSTGDMRWQQQRFRTHIAAARQASLPLIIHTRAAQDDTLAIMREARAAEAGGVMHCFTESWEMAKACLDLGFYISFSGIVTFKNAKALQEVAKKVPLDRMLIETDSPYLAPDPYRGKPNEPAYVKYVALKVAELRGQTYETIAQATTENYHALFFRYLV